MTPVLRTRASVRITRGASSATRSFHASLLRRKGDEEEFEIDLITLKKRPRWRAKDLKDVVAQTAGRTKKTQEQTVEIHQSLFDDAMKAVMDEERDVPKEALEGPMVSNIEIRMPPTPQREEKVRDDLEIVNVNKPRINVKEPELNDIKERNRVLVSELTNLRPGERADRIQDILKLVSHEIPALSKEAAKLADGIEDNISKMKEIRSRIDEAQKKEQSALEEFLKKKDPEEDVTLKIKREDLEKFLKNAKLTKDRDDENHFREQRRFEWSQSINSSRSLDKRNFFTPIDEKLIRRVKRGIVPKMIDNHDDLLFPMLPKASNNLVHEFLTFIDGKKIVTAQNPFGRHYHSPDLVSIFREIGDSKPHLKVINKLEKDKWRLIGSKPMGESRVLVFERYIDKEQESKDQRKKRFRTWAAIALVAFGTLNTIGFILETQQPRTKCVIENGKPTKSTT